MTTSDEAFRLLSKAPGGDYTLRESDTVVAAGPVRHALDPAGRRTLLLPIPDRTADVSDNASRGVSVRSGDLELDGVLSRFILVTCTEPSLNDLFSKVCDEIVSSCAATPEAPGSVTAVVLERWRDLLGPGRRLLSESELKGLLAELHMLEALAALDPVKALTAWIGPERAPRDFSGPGIDVEVKASASADEIRVRIHGLTQLVASVGSDLFLVVERLEFAPTDGDSVRAAIERLIDVGVDEVALLKKLSRAGAHAPDLSVYDSLRFKTVQTLAWRVDDDFPRITAQLLSGSPASGRVHSVEYLIEFAASPPVPLSDVELSKMFSRFDPETR